MLSSLCALVARWNHFKVASSAKLSCICSWDMGQKGGSKSITGALKSSMRNVNALIKIKIFIIKGVLVVTDNAVARLLESSV